MKIFRVKHTPTGKYYYKTTAQFFNHRLNRNGSIFRETPFKTYRDFPKRLCISNALDSKLFKFLEFKPEEFILEEYEVVLKKTTILNKLKNHVTLI